MSAFEFLGLDSTAGERDIKRAYAQRLKSARPDVDPQAFQALHEAYQAALAEVRWRTREERDGGAPPAPDVGEPEEPRTAPGEPQALAPVTDDPRQPELSPSPAASSLLQALDEAADAGEEDAPPPFTLELYPFIESVFEASRTRPPQDFALWLHRAMADWPLSVAPMVAERVVEALWDYDMPLMAGHLDSIAQAFALDDVHAGISPLEMQQLRQRFKEREADWYSVYWRSRLEPLSEVDARLALLEEVLKTAPDAEARQDVQQEYVVELLAPAARGALRQYLKAGGADLTPEEIEGYLKRLTGDGALLRAKMLRFVPIVFERTNRFLKALGRGRDVALGRAFDPRAVAYWRERPLVAQLSVVFFVCITLFHHLRDTTLEDMETNVDRAIIYGKYEKAFERYVFLYDSIPESGKTIFRRSIARVFAKRIHGHDSISNAENTIYNADLMLRYFGSIDDTEIRFHSAYVTYLKGRALAVSGRKTKALDVLDDFITRYQGSSLDVMRYVSLAYLTKAGMIHGDDKPDLALQELDRFFNTPAPDETIDDRANIAMARYLRGRFLNLLGRKADALKAWEEFDALSGTQGGSGVRMFVARSLIDRAELLEGEASIAVADLGITRYERGNEVQMKPFLARLRYQKARALLTLNRKDEAIAELRTLIDNHNQIYDEKRYGAMGDVVDLLKRLSAPQP